MQRIAIVAPLAVLGVAAGAVVGARLLTPRPSAQLVFVPVAVTPARSHPPRARPAPAPAHAYLGPVGDFLPFLYDSIAPRGGDGPPVLFLLDRAELASYRYAWELPTMAKLAARDIAAVLADGCKDTCPDDAQHVRDAAQELAGDGEAEPHDGDPRVRRWQDDDVGVTTDHRVIALRRTAGPFALDLACSCDSWTVGMRMWNDMVTCDATISEHGKTLASYRPRVLTDNGGKEGVFTRLDAFDQTIELASGARLAIASGYNYSGGVDREQLTDVPLVKTQPRGALVWSR
ncbi:MAG TPA: hypothetical protein VMJ10_37200 [Kofleriaceae bacterium]|nr:hypothetical protein [Kofleriaceae bacterium]